MFFEAVVTLQTKVRRRKVKREGDEKKERNGNKKKRGCMFVCVCL